MKYLLICFTLISKVSFAQVEYTSLFYDEILRENFYDTKNVMEVGLIGRVKNIKLYIQSAKKNSKNVIEREPQFGFFYEFDKLGRVQSNFIYDTIEQVKKSKSIINKKQKNYIFYNKAGVIEKEVRDGGTVTDYYDSNGNIIESVIAYPENDIAYQLTAYTYDKNNKILQKTEYWQTTKRDSLTIQSITKNELDEKENILKSNVVNGPRKYTTTYDYDGNNNPISISNPMQNITMEYDEKNSLEKIEISSDLGDEIIQYKNKKILSKEYTYEGKKNKNLAYTYRYDKNGNWVFCNIDVTIYNEQNESIQLKYEIIREIEYYR